MQSALNYLTAILAGPGQIVGIRSSIEEPRYVVEEKIGDIEIRRYQLRIAAETEVDGAAEDARSAGFRRVAAYIFGANKVKGQIAMTAPVAQSSVNIAMTAPVAQAKASEGRWKIQFFMPASFALETLPTPDDPSVRLVVEPPQLYAVLRFAGNRSGAAMAEKAARLLSVLQSSRWRPYGEPIAWFYDPPWTIPAFRRNEVAAPVAEP